MTYPQLSNVNCQMSILIITYYFPPSGGSGVQRWLKFVKYLPQLGFEPIVLTVDEKYASYPQIDASLVDDIPENVRVIKTKTKEVLRFYKKVSPSGELPHTGFANERKPNLLQKISRFIRGNFFLPDPRKGWNKYAFKEASRLIEEEGIDTVITTSPPHSTQLIGLELKRRYPHIKWVADLRDPWTDIYYNKELYQTPYSRKKNAEYERSVLENADAIVTVSRECERNFCSKTKNLLPISVIPNGYDPDDFKAVKPATDADKSKKFTISYVGALSPVYEIETFCRAVKRLTPEQKASLRLRFVGGAHEAAKAEIDKLGVETDWVGYVSHAEAVSYMVASDLLLLLLPNQTENKGIVTGKIFEYMASGNPVLMIGFPDGDAAKIIAPYQQGGVFNFGDFKAVSEYLAGAMQTRPEVKKEAAGMYSRSQLASQMAEIIF